MENELEISELRAIRNDSGKTVLTGYAAVFNKDSRILRTKGGQKFRERILPGAFTEELADGTREVRATVLHNQSVILGRRTKGTVKLSEDKHGLRAEIELPDTTAGRDAAVQVERGDLDKMSFGFDDMDCTTVRGTDGVFQRTISRIKDLKEITICDNRAAYPDTALSLRMAEDAIDGDDVTPELQRHILDKAVREFSNCIKALNDPNEKRAIVGDEDNSLTYHCQGITQMARDLARAIDHTHTACERLDKKDATLQPHDHRAIRDAAAAIKDVRRRVTPSLAALAAISADPDDDDSSTSAAGTVPPLDDNSRSQLLQALMLAGFRTPEQMKQIAAALTELTQPAIAPATAA